MPSQRTRSPTIWFEIGDLFVHFNWDLHPTGIQRVALEILQAAHASHPDRVGFCRLSWRTGRFEQVDFARIRAVSSAPEWAERPSRGWMARATMVARQALRALGRTVRISIRDRIVARPTEREFDRAVAGGDWLICLGLPWRYPVYGAAIAAAKDRYGVRFGLLIHDLIPITHPQFCKPDYLAAFSPWLESVFGVCDVIFTSSIYCAETVRELGRRRGWPLPRIQRIPFGAGYAYSAARDAAQLDVPTPFVLFVSSFQRRKNHALLLRVWQTLVHRHGAAAVPALVFVGAGSLGVALPADFRADDAVHNKVIAIRRASDAALRDLYRRCLFTVYPSLVEGWGLPVAESLSFGKFCLASNRTSLPEVGGDLIDYFDPEDEAEALGKIERALFDPAYLAARTARLATNYRAPSWTDSVTALIAAVDAPVANAAQRAIGGASAR